LAREIAAPGIASPRMSRQRRHDTGPELALRAELHRRGLRFRVHVRPVAGFRREADIVFLGSRVAVFVDGCFWHGCPDHRTYPKRNASFWSDKIEMNRLRDTETDDVLDRAGWLSIRVWEHEPAIDAADRVVDCVMARSSSSNTQWRPPLSWIS
jgi:DNA mismatch endonuclease (patch repair protein)